MLVPEGYATRAPTPDDRGAVGAVLEADELDDAGVSTLGEHFVEREWGREGFELAADAWVAVDAAGAVVGYSQAHRESPEVVQSWGVVHPAHRGRGIGSALVDRIEARAGELAAAEPQPPRLRHATNANDRGIAALLAERRFGLIRHFWHMLIELDGAPDPGPEPKGVRIAGVETDDDIRAVHGVLVQAFAGDWDYHPEPFERWTGEQAGDRDEVRALWAVAWDGDAAVGALTASGGPERGWVDELGVLATHRGRGVGPALLRRSFAAFAARGQRQVVLSVDSANPTRATALYERAGMRIVKGWDLWERPLGRS